MRKLGSLVLFTLVMLALLPVTAKESILTFEPGKSLGAAVLGQRPEVMLQAFPGWTYEIEGYAIGDVYHFPKTEPDQFLIGFTKDHKLDEITVRDKAIRMKGVPSIGPGCSKAEVLKQFGKPSTDSVSDFGGNWDYDAKGICFHFAAKAEKQRDPAPYGPEKCEAISIYQPGKSRYKSS